MDHRRFLLAMGLSGLVLFFWSLFMAPPAVEELDEETVVAEEEADPVDRAAPPGDPEDDTPTLMADDDAEPRSESRRGRDVVVPEIDRRVDRMVTPFITVDLDNQGAIVRDVQVNAPDQFAGVGGDLMRSFDENAKHWPFTLHFLDQTVELDPEQRFVVVEEESQLDASGQSYEKITYRHDDPRGRFTIDKVYTVDQRSYVLRLELVVTNHLEDMRLVDTPALDIIGRDDPDKETSWMDILDFRPDVLGGVCMTTDGSERSVFGRMEGSETHSQYDVLWAGAETRYFVMAVVPDNGADACSFEPVNGDYLRTRLTFDRFSIEPGSSWSSRHALYMGPKDFTALRAAGSRLEEAVDYGFFTVLARPLRAALAFFYNLLGRFGFANWGLAIILLTLVIKLVTWPLTQKAYVNAERMKLLQPRMKELKEKYENDQQRMSEETMKLMREEKVSPLGCLPLLIQMPILYGLFIMIYNSADLYNASFLYFADLSAPDPFFILPVLMGAVMFVQQRFTMSAATMNPQMVAVFKIMPIMFTAFMVFLPAGLVLYYLLNLILGVLQQFLIKRQFQKADEAGEAA